AARAPRARAASPAARSRRARPRLRRFQGRAPRGSRRPPPARRKRGRTGRAAGKRRCDAWNSLSMAWARAPGTAGTTAILVRRLGRPELAAAVHAGAVEAAGAALARGQLVAGRGNALHARLGLLARGHPLDPVAARDRGDVVPGRLRRRAFGQRLAEVRRQLRLGLPGNGRDFKRHRVTGLHARGLEQLPFDLEPVAALPVRLQRGLERRARETALDAHLGASGKPGTGRLRQDEERPGRVLRPCGAVEGCFETHGGGCWPGHAGTLSPAEGRTRTQRLRPATTSETSRPSSSCTRTYSRSLRDSVRPASMRTSSAWRMRMICGSAEPMASGP